MIRVSVVMRARDAIIDFFGDSGHSSNVIVGSKRPVLFAMVYDALRKFWTDPW